MARTKQTLEHTGDLQIQDGAGLPITSRKKSSAPSANRRVKSCQIESASSSAKSILESSDSEIGPWQDASFTSY